MYESALRKILQIPLEKSIAYFREVMLQDIMDEESATDVKAITLQILRN